MKIAFIIPTKDRPNDLARMMDSLVNQTRLPDQIIVVDASATPVKAIVDAYTTRTRVNYVRWSAEPSAAAQRNAGVEMVGVEMDLVCFFDDDQILQRDALEKMLEFWERAVLDQGGASFNLANYSDKRSSLLKKSKLTEKLGLYCGKAGAVAKSGWQSLYGKVSSNTDVEWMSSQASVWRREVLNNYSFDEFFTGYSYLEDLDFSYSVSRKYLLTIVADALFEHYHSASGRISLYNFGKIEVRNRLYFVKKHGLSIPMCYTGILLRLLMTIIQGIKDRNVSMLQRAWGNVAQVLCSR